MLPEAGTGVESWSGAYDIALSKGPVSIVTASEGTFWLRASNRCNSPRLTGPKIFFKTYYSSNVRCLMIRCALQGLKQCVPKVRDGSYARRSWRWLAHEAEHSDMRAFHGAEEGL